MIDKNLFLETLHEVAEIAATSSEKIKPEEVHRYFEGMELSEEQEKMVYEYLNLPPEQGGPGSRSAIRPQKRKNLR